MKFIDTAKIKVSSGKGGNGIIAWRREKYEPRGGPAGGDGGRGGHVFLEASKELGTLLDFKYKSIFKAQDGEKGGPKKKTGRSGEDIVIKVPCGTVVKDAATKEIICDLVHDEQNILIAEGGKGGRGNARFATSARQAPHFCEPGETGIERELELELKLIAEVGIIGMPNAGKSTLISVVSSAKPKIADYPFTTLVPNLGVVKKPDGDGVVIADLPGLIEGASKGCGLGHDFIRHIERTRLLIHIIDSSGTNGKDPLEAYKIIQRELGEYHKSLLEKKQLVVLNKMDLLTEEEINNIHEKFKREKLKPVIISAVTKRNVDKFLNKLFYFLEKNPQPQTQELISYFDSKACDHKTNEYFVYRKRKKYFVEGRKVEGLVSVTDLRDYQSVAHLMRVLKKIGIFDELKKEGIREGDSVCISGIDFEYSPETMILE